MGLTDKLKLLKKFKEGYDLTKRVYEICGIVPKEQSDLTPQNWQDLNKNGISVEDVEIVYTKLGRPPEGVVQNFGSVAYSVQEATKLFLKNPNEVYQGIKKIEIKKEIKSMVWEIVNHLYQRRRKK